MGHGYTPTEPSVECHIRRKGVTLRDPQWGTVRPAVSELISRELGEMLCGQVGLSKLVDIYELPAADDYQQTALPSTPTRLFRRE